MLKGAYPTVKETQMLPSSDATPPAEVPTKARRLLAAFVELPRSGQSYGWRRSFFRALCRTGLLILLCLSLLSTLVLSVSVCMVDTTADGILSMDEAEEALAAGEYDCILVLGAGVRADGTPSDMLYDRVKLACDLYAAGVGRVPLLMSGDHTGNYNEVGVMKNQASSAGVPTEDVFLDHKGYSTYESLYRAKAVFGAKRILIVTQEYHLYRALHIARELGMEAVGVSADLRPYRGQTRYEAREILARFKDLFTAARGDYKGHLDLPVDLNGDGNLT